MSPYNTVLAIRQLNPDDTIKLAYCVVVQSGKSGRICIWHWFSDEFFVLVLSFIGTYILIVENERTKYHVGYFRCIKLIPKCCLKRIPIMNFLRHFKSLLMRTEGTISTCK